MKKRKTIYVFFIFIIFLYACDETYNLEELKESSREYYEEVDSVGNLEYSYYKIDEKLDGIAKSYHPNGKVHEEVLYNNGQPEGFKSIYNQEGKLIEKRNYRISEDDNHPVVNEWIFYKENGEIDTNSSHYSEVSLKDLCYQIRVFSKVDSSYLFVKYNNRIDTVLSKNGDFFRYNGCLGINIKGDVIFEIYLENKHKVFDRDSIKEFGRTYSTTTWIEKIIKLPN
jgi:antitoxin component YwqK of YwqJK toxin-antitoxin module